jgi:hypothetical protein
MKKLLFLTCVITLLTTTGCLAPVGGGPGYDRHYERGYGYGHGRYHGRSEVIVRAPVVVAPAPVIVVPAPVLVVPRVRVRVD